MMEYFSKDSRQKYHYVLYVLTGFSIGQLRHYTKTCTESTGIKNVLESTIINYQIGMPYASVEYFNKDSQQKYQYVFYVLTCFFNWTTKTLYKSCTDIKNFLDMTTFFVSYKHMRHVFVDL